MFSNRIINSARFLKMPVDSQLLYFHLGMHADDDGIVEAYPIMKSVGSKEDNLTVLAAKGLVRVLNEDLITHITDWGEHNLIRADRKVDSIYKHLLLQIVPEIELKEPKPRADTGVIPRQLTGRPVDRISKDKLSKDKLPYEKNSSNEEEPIGSKPKEPLEPKQTKPNLPREIIMHYLGKIYGKDMPPLSPLIKRNATAAKDLLEMAGSVERAKQEIDLIEKVYARKNLSWTLETIVKHWGKIGEPHYKGKPIRRGKNNTVEIEHNGKWVIADFQIKKEDITYE